MEYLLRRELRGIDVPLNTKIWMNNVLGGSYKSMLAMFQEPVAQLLHPTG